MSSKNNPIVFITGAGRRIGRGLAINYAKKGWDVAINYNKSEEEAERTKKQCESYGIRAILAQADVSKKSEIKNAIDKCVNELGIPDVLVNNAGIFPEETELQNISEELLEHTLSVNLKGEFYSSQYYAEIANEGARIVNFASLGAFEIWKNRLPYHLSKVGVVQLTKTLARDLAPKISVNCVCPGTIVVPNEAAADSSLISTDKIPMKRYGTVEDIFDAVYFFSTASNFITSQVLLVDGGYHYSR